MHFNSYPDDWILLIFARLPLQTLLRIEIVCRRWQSVQQVACRNRHTLMLFVGKDPLDYLKNKRIFETPFADELVNENGTRMFVSSSDIAKWHGLECAQLSKPLCEWLVDRLPNVTSLQINIDSRAFTMIEPMMSLLSGWSSKLITLDLSLESTAEKDDYFDDIEPQAHQEFDQNYLLLLGALNFLPALKNLTLDIGARFFSPDEMQRNSRQISLPILSQLNQFYFSSYGHPDVILDSLVRYGEPNANLRQIGVCDLYITQDCLDKFVKLSPELRSLFTHLLPLITANSSTVFDYCFDFGLDTICSQFTSQTTLQFNNIRDIPFYEVINTLSSLKQLLFLGLFYLLEFDQFHLADPRIVNCSIAQLFSVRVLYLDVCITSHTHLSQMNIPWVFPNLQALEIVYSSMKCVECGYEDSQKITTEKRRECMTILLEPLKKCTRLRTVKFGKYNEEDYQIECFNIDDIIKPFTTK